MENLYLPANHFARRWREIVQMSLITGWLIWTVQNFQSCRAKDSALEIHRPLWTVLVRIADLARVRNTICPQHCLFVWSFVYLTTCLLLRCSRISVTFSAFLITYFSPYQLVYLFTCLVAYLFTCLQFFFNSAVISSTFPIILKCSPPATRFVIDEVTINLYNGTRILVSPTSNVLRECNGNSRRVNGRYECQFSVQYSKYGIGMQAVNTVTVKYHCRKTWVTDRRSYNNFAFFFFFFLTASISHVGIRVRKH